MKELFINNSFNFINKHQSLDHYNQVKIKYGLEVMYHFFTKLFVVLLLSVYLKTIPYIIPLFISFGILRTFGYGIHAKTNKLCWFFTIFIYVILGLYLKYFSFNHTIKLLLFFLSLLSVTLWAPSDTKGRPLVNKNKRIFLKTMCIFAVILEVIISYSTNLYFKDVFVISTSLEAIMINPFLYKITNTTRNNYRFVSIA